MTTSAMIPAFILALLGAGSDGAGVQTQVLADDNIICYSVPARAVCFSYTDDGDSLRLHLNES